MPTCALSRFPELTTFLSMLGHPHPAMTLISFLDKNLTSPDRSRAKLRHAVLIQLVSLKPNSPF
uniref:Uncharacterized protein LOC105123766 isoform X2 n=1 Tax=Rhizophora mucronata TaxID=61149 RepID=A0A2P2IX31_RHIMU